MNNIFANKALLRWFLGLVFISAGIYRIFNWHQAIIEFTRFHLFNVPFLIVLMIILEVVGGLFLIFSIKTKWALSALIAFIALALIDAFIADGKNIISGLGQLFTFNTAPSDVFLHFTYLIILIYLLGKK